MVIARKIKYDVKITKKVTWPIDKVKCQEYLNMSNHGKNTINLLEINSFHSMYNNICDWGIGLLEVRSCRMTSSDPYKAFLLITHGLYI